MNPAVLGVEGHPGQVLQVDLMDDPGVGRDDAEVIEGVLAPAEEGVPLAVALELQLRVDEEGPRGPGLVDLDRVVDDQLDRLEGVDLAGIAAQALHRVAHRGEVDDRRHPREVLEEHPAGPEGDLGLGLCLRLPGGEGLDIVGRDRDAIFVAQEVFQQDLQGERQACHVEPGAAQGVEPIIVEGLPIHLERRSGVEGIGHGLSSRSRAGGLSHELYVNGPRD